MLHLSWVLKYHLYFNLSSWRKAYLIDDQSRGNNKQSGYVYVYERAEKIVEGKVCTISFERPVNYLCYAWHVFPPKYEAWTHFNN